MTSNVVKLHTRSGAQRSPDRYAEVLAAGQPFHAANMHGAPYELPFTAPAVGKLPERYATMFNSYAPDYVVWSWATPIAWHVPPSRGGGGLARWYVPAVHYSQTTDRHQSLILAAVTRVTETWGDAPVIR